VEWSGDWVVAIPLKGLGRAKSRILLGPGGRASLALAMALDTAAAALASPVVAAVHVICGDDAAAAFEELGCRVVLDRGEADLNQVLVAARDRARAVAPTSGFASLVADLPGLRPEHVTEALGAAGRHPRSFVPDAAGSGTTLLAALPGGEYAPSYGSVSAARHRRAGATPLRLPPHSALRRDVDTLADLAAVATGGVGRHTSRVLGGLRQGSLHAAFGAIA
jgi:2-phospho-L-lactate guanylyltransferase